jgi:hypothetical protein
VQLRDRLTDRIGDHALGVIGLAIDDRHDHHVRERVVPSQEPMCLFVTFGPTPRPVSSI